MKITQPDELDVLWDELEIQRGELLMCHSFLGSLGKVDGGPRAVIDALLRRLGPDGHLVVPAFTYSYFNNEIYDRETSPSTVGVLGDVLREYPGAVRSDDPVFSMVCVGPHASELMRRVRKNSFGAGSIYERLCDHDLNILLLGVDFTALSLFMHLEKVFGVPYRYDKNFRGVSTLGGQRVEDEIIHFVRDLDVDFETDRRPIGAKIEADERCRVVKFRYGSHRHVSARAIKNIVARELDRDQFALVRLKSSRRGVGNGI